MKMDDAQAPPAGTEGTVRGVDDIGSIPIARDTGGSLNVVLGEDEVEIIGKKQSLKSIPLSAGNR